jgi:hypothetical protein
LAKETGFFFLLCTLFHTASSAAPQTFNVSEDAGIEPRIAATFALAVRRSNLSTRSHPHHPLAKYNRGIFLIFFLRTGEICHLSQTAKKQLISYRVSNLSSSIKAFQLILLAACTRKKLVTFEQSQRVYLIQQLRVTQKTTIRECSAKKEQWKKCERERASNIKSVPAQMGFELSNKTTI